jgi:TRAP-type C4-dicarboxylate transport system substrate-binding protein
MRPLLPMASVELGLVERRGLMDRSKGRTRHLALLFAAVILAAGCGASGAAGDKAGGSSAPVELRLAITGDGLEYEPQVEYFVQHVATVSSGRLRIKVVPFWGRYAPGAEQQVVRDVGAGKVDLGYTDAAMFDTLGVNSFQALLAPMLIDSYAVENAVARSDIPSRMMKSLDGLGVTGVVWLPGRFHKPAGATRPLLGPADWRGITFALHPSKIQADGVRALGAKPIEAFGGTLSDDLDRGVVGGYEKPLLWFQLPIVLADRHPRYVTANVSLWTDNSIIVADPHRLAKLTHQQRDWLGQAATDAAAHATVIDIDDAPLVARLCASGVHVFSASNADVAGLRAALAPFYAHLEQDPETKELIERIEALKRSTPPDKPLAIPAGCSAVAPPPTTVAELAPLTGPGPTGSFPRGTYRYTWTVAGGLAFHPLDRDGAYGNAGVWTWTMGDGVWSLKVAVTYPQFTCEGKCAQSRPVYPCSGWYAVKGDTVTFTVTVDKQPVGSCAPPTWEAHWSVDRDGRITWSRTNPADFGSPLPWEKVG